MPINILGAGVSGLTSAIKLAEAGEKVVIFEKNSFVGGSTGGNVQAIRNYDLPKDQLEYFAKNNVILNNLKPINKIIKYSPSGKGMEVEANSRPLFYVLKRGASRDSIDLQLYEQALDTGVKFNFNQKKTLKSGDIIAVDSIYKNIWAYGAVFRGVTVDPERIFFFMDNRYAPQGYVYMLPYGRHEISIACVSFDMNCALPVLFDRFLRENKIVRKTIENASFENNFSGYAYSNIPATAEVKGKKFVGAAAGFIDPSRGFGVRYAIESGLLAAKAITEGKNYDSLWKKSFEKELLKEFRRRILLEKMSNEDYEELILGDRISIKKYEKIPSSLQRLLKGIKFMVALGEWRKKYDLTRLFS